MNVNVAKTFEHNSKDVREAAFKVTNSKNNTNADSNNDNNNNTATTTTSLFHDKAIEKKYNNSFFPIKKLKNRHIHFITKNLV